MDADNFFGREGAASLAPALEKMSQLTSLHLGRTSMDYADFEGNNIGPEGAASLAPALEKMAQLTSLDLACARIRIGRGLGGLGGPGSLSLAVGYALGCDVVWFGVRACGRGMCATVCKVRAEGAGGDGCRE
jgi:hypothetical protein